MYKQQITTPNIPESATSANVQAFLRQWILHKFIQFFFRFCESVSFLRKYCKCTECYTQRERASMCTYSEWTVCLSNGIKKYEQIKPKICTDFFLCVVAENVWKIAWIKFEIFIWTETKKILEIRTQPHWKWEVFACDHTKIASKY